MIAKNLYFMTLLVSVTFCKEDSDESLYDYSQDGYLTPVISYKGNNAIRGWPLKLSAAVVNPQLDVATTRKSSLWMSGQGGRTVQTGNSTKRESVSEKVTTEMIPLKGESLNLYIRPQAYSVEQEKPSGFGFGYGVKRYETYKWSNSDFNIISGWDSSFNKFKFQSNYDIKSRYPSGEDNKGSTSTSSQDTHNDGSTVRVDSGVQPDRKLISGKILINRLIREVIPSKSSDVKFRMVSDTSTALPSSSVSTTDKINVIPSTENPSFLDRAHHFMQRWMMWKNYKSESLSFSEAKFI